MSDAVKRVAQVNNKKEIGFWEGTWWKIAIAIGLYKLNYKLRMSLQSLLEGTMKYGRGGVVEITIEGMLELGSIGENIDQSMVWCIIQRIIEGMM